MTRSVPILGTIVTIRTVDEQAGVADAPEVSERVERALGWFQHVEDACTRFDRNSEAMRLSTRIGEPVPVSALLFEAVRFALAVASASDGAFDPTVGLTMEGHGFNREHRSGDLVTTGISGAEGATFRDVSVDATACTVTLHRPLVLDLGAVAKGLAIDLAARELRPLRNFAIDAGGDLYLGGHGPEGPWAVGIRHPRVEDTLIDSWRVSDMSVCTSGDYERRTGTAGGHHLLDPRTGSTATRTTSATVVASSAMVADALSTAAFVLGPVAGVRFLEDQGVDGIIVSESTERHATRGIGKAFSGVAILPDAEGVAGRGAGDPGGARWSGRRAGADRAGAG